jgi:hypothetical protein
MNFNQMNKNHFENDDFGSQSIWRISDIPFAIL